jgi:hypothetical protein
LTRKFFFDVWLFDPISGKNIHTIKTAYRIRSGSRHAQFSVISRRTSQMKMHAIKLLSAICLAASAVAAHAIVVANPPGTYTYDFGLPNGASFTWVSSEAPLFSSGSGLLSYSFNGTPDSNFTGTLVSTTAGTTTPGGVLDYEMEIQYNNNTTGYGNVLVFSFVEPQSFWATLGSPAFGTGDGESIDGLTYISGYDSSINEYDDNYGSVGEGAYYGFYPDTDPPCTSCTVSISFAAALASTPEPSSLVLLSTGVAGMMGMYRRRRR